MSNNEFNLDFIGCLQQTKSKRQINADIRQIEKAINMLRITGTLAKGDTKREINTYIKELSEKLGYVKLKGKIDEKNLKQEINKSLHNMSFEDIDALKVDENKTKLKLKKVISDVKAYAEKNTISVNVGMKKEKLNNDLTTFLNKNTKIRESSFLLEESERIRELINSVDDKGTLKDATEAFQLYKSEVSATGYATKSTSDKIKAMLSHITKIGSFFGLASLAVNNFRKSLSTLKGNDKILSEISKTSEMTKKQLEELNNEAFKVASRYGKLSSDYLLSVQDMSRAGYLNSNSMAELSIAAQGAGNMTAELANKYIIATDKAFKMNGSVEVLTATLDGANNITNHNAVNMTELGTAMSIVGSQAASAGLEVNETTAAVATMIAVTQRSGSEMANAFKGILMNLRQVSGDVGDGENIIDAESLTKYEKACAELGVSLKEVRNGVVSLKEPMQIIKELSEEYTKLDEADARRANLLSAVGGKYRANALNSLLENYDMYSKMLDEYANGLGSMNEEAEKTANSWEGRLNALQNSIDSFFNTLTNKDAIKGGISFFDRLIQGAEALTNTIGEIPVVLTAVNTAMTAMNKDYGITQIYDKDKGKIDIQGNLLGIDFTAVKNMKKHFAEAEEVLSTWNDGLKSGKANIETFNSELIKNNTQFKEYLSTCKDAPASIEGYKAHLNAAGVATDGLRLKTVLLNAAISFGIGLAMQAVTKIISLAVSAWDHFNVTVKEVQENIDNLTSNIESLNTELDELNSKSNLTDAEQERLKYLETRISLEERLLKIEKTRLASEQLGNPSKITDWFDEDSYVKKASLEFGEDAVKRPMSALGILFPEINNLINLIPLMNNISAFANGAEAVIKKGNVHYEEMEQLKKLYEQLIEERDTFEVGSYNWQFLDEYAARIASELEAYQKQVTSGSYADLLEKYGQYTKEVETLEGILENSDFLSADEIANAQKLLELYSSSADQMKELINKIAISIGDQSLWIGTDLELLDSKTDRLTADTIQSNFTDEEIKVLAHLDFDRDASISTLRSLLKEEQEVADDEPISFTIEDYKDQIDDFQSKVKTLGDALSSIRSGNFEDSDLTDLLQEFPELTDKSDDLESALVELINNSLKVLYDTLGDEVPDSLKTSLQELTDIASGTAMHLGDAFSSIHSSWDILQDFKDTMASGFDDNITDSLLQSVRGLSGELETLVAGYYSGIVSAEELYEALTEHYENDLHNYSEALIKKNDLNEGFYNAVGLASEEVTNQFMDDYNVDLQNCKTYNQAKLEIEKQTIGKISGAWSQYYDAQSKTLKISMSEIEARAAHGGGDAAAFLEQYELIENYEAAIEALNDITYNGIKSNFESISSKWDTNSSSSTKEFSEELNWVEKLINRVSTALDKLKDKVSNTYIGWSIRNNSLSKAMEKTNDEINVQQQAYEKYMQKAASVGLSQEYVNKIHNGSLDIEDITDEALSDRIKEYETWYDKATDCSDAIEKLRTQLAELAKQKFDNINTYFSGLMETTEKAISRLETKEKNTFKAPSVKVYNGLYDETQNLINYNTQKVQQLEEALDSAVNSGYIEAGSEAWRDMYNEILEVHNATEEYKLELQDISKRRYDAIIKPIEQELAQVEQRRNINEKMQDRLALQGYVKAKGLYERQIRDSESRLNTLKEQAALLQQNMEDALSKGMEIGSDDWIDMKSAIDENVISVMELENSIIELNNAIRDLEWGKFDRFQSSISRITGESDFMISMYSKDDTYDEDGKLTDAGSAVIGLHAQNYFAYKEQAKAYKDEVDKINKELEADPTNTTLIDRKNTLIDAYQNATKAAYDEYQAVIELGKDGYQAQIDSIQELIDAKKKQLEADKSLYEYQKNIAEKTKNIADIQKQLSALANDDSEENKAKIQKLKVDLTDAQKDLEDTQYDKWYNDQQDMLDRLAEEYAALISEQSQNEQEVFQEMIEYVNANAQGIQDTISSTAEEWGYVFSHGIDSVLEPGISGITDIGQSIYEEIQRLYELNERMYKVSADLADLGVTDYGLETTISDETTARNFIERLYNGLLGRHSDEDGLNFWMNKLMNGETVQDMLEGFLNSDEYLAMGKSAEDTILDFYRGLLGRTADSEGFNYWKEQYHNGMSLGEIGTHGFLDSDEFLSRDQWLNMLDAQPAASDYYAQCTKHGLTPVNLNEEFLKRGLQVIDPSTFLNARITPQMNVPDYLKQQNVVNNENNSFGDTHINNTITIPIEHVTDYNDLVTQLQKDGKFEKMIEDMTIGKLAGKNSLSKNSYRWT